MTYVIIEDVFDMFAAFCNDQLGMLITSVVLLGVVIALFGYMRRAIR